MPFPAMSTSSAMARTSSGVARRKGGWRPITATTGYTSIPTGFSISSLKAPMSWAPSAPSTAR
jgi:hypothetical protein